MDCMNKLKTNKVSQHPVCMLLPAQPCVEGSVGQIPLPPTGHTAREACSPGYGAYNALPPGVPGVPEGAEQDATVQEKSVASGVQLLERTTAPSWPQHL